MYEYTGSEWLFFFYFYCFFGWCFETIYVSFCEKKFVNRGFMRGPFLPLYGSGALVMLISSAPFQDHIILVYISGCIGATTLEYFTGVIMEGLFKVRYWDYSEKKFNFQGQICLSSTLAWGILTIFMTEVIHIRVEEIVLSLPSKAVYYITIAITFVIVTDFVLSFKAAISLRNVLVSMKNTKENIERVQNRLDHLVMNAGEQLSTRKEVFVETMTGYKLNKFDKLKMDELKETIENNFEILKTKNFTKTTSIDEIKEEIMKLRSRYNQNIETREKLKVIKNFYQKNMIKSNPSMVSGKYKEEFDEIKQYLSKKINKKKS